MQMNQTEVKSVLLGKLPQEIKNLILEYTTRCSIYNGIPMLKISEDDERYEILSRIRKIQENTIFQYESHYGCKTIVWFRSGAQLMYCNDQRSYMRPTEPNHSIVFRMRKRRAHPDDHKWKSPEITKIL
jgi:hypothetical protein